MRKMIVKHAPTDVMVLRKIPVRLDGEFLVILVGGAPRKRGHAEWIAATRQDALELQGYWIEAGNRDLIVGKWRLYDHLLARVCATRRAGLKAGRVRIEHLPRVKIQACGTTGATGIGARAL